jgi:hypothetical protein
MPTAIHKIIKAAVLPPRRNADYGVSFEFDDGWIAAHRQWLVCGGCPENGDVPKSPLLQIGSPGAIGSHDLI